MGLVGRLHEPAAGQRDAKQTRITPALPSIHSTHIRAALYITEKDGGEDEEMEGEWCNWRYIRQVNRVTRRKLKKNPKCL